MLSLKDLEAFEGFARLFRPRSLVEHGARVLFGPVGMVLAPTLQRLPWTLVAGNRMPSSAAEGLASFSERWFMPEKAVEK
jgi:hypothetical protein